MKSINHRVKTSQRTDLQINRPTGSWSNLQNDTMNDPVAMQRAVSDPKRLSPGAVLQLQRVYGNRAVQQWLQHHWSPSQAALEDERSTDSDHSVMDERSSSIQSVKSTQPAIQRYVMPKSELEKAGTTKNTTLFGHIIHETNYSKLMGLVEKYHAMDATNIAERKIILQKIIATGEQWKNSNARNTTDPSKQEMDLNRRTAIENLISQAQDETGFLDKDSTEVQANPAVKDVKGETKTYTPVYVETEEPLFKSGNPSMEDVAQGALGDCFLLAAAASLANRDPGLIKQMMWDNGKTVTVRFFIDHQPKYVTVVKTVPKVIVPGENGDPDQYVDAYAKNVLWVQMLEKAYAADRASFSSIEGGTGDTALSVLLGSRTTKVGQTMSVSDTDLPWPALCPSDTAARIEGRKGPAKLNGHGKTIKTYSLLFEGDSVKVSAWKAYVEDKQSYEALKRCHTLEALHQHLEDSKLDKDIQTRVISWVNSRKLLPGNMGTGKYTELQIKNFEEIKQAVDSKKMIVAGSNASVGRADPGDVGHSGGESKVKGLVGGHQYTVVGYSEHNGVCFVTLRNPWGYYGRKYIQNEETNELEPVATEPESKENTTGVFSLEINDLFTHFTEIIYA